MSAGSRTSRRASSRPFSRAMIAVLAALVMVGSAGIFAAFTSNDNATQSVSTGTVIIHITNDANAGHITDAWTNRAAGDTITRTFTVANTSSLDISALTLTLTAPDTDLLIADPNGLQAQVFTCSAAYTSNTCSGTETLRQGTASVSTINGTAFSIKDATDLPAGQNVFVKAIVSLPYAASNTLQDQSTHITYTVNALQRDSVNDPATAQSGEPSTPDSGGISVNQTGEGAVSVSFSAPSDNGNAIDDYRATVHSTPTVIYTTTSPFSVAGLTNGSHTLTLAAHNADGWSAESSPVSFTVTPTSGLTVPSAPTGATATSNEDSQSTVSWTAPSNNGGASVTDYAVSVFNSSGGAASGVTGATTRDVGGTTTSYLFGGLTNGTAYTFKVAAINSQGTSSPSAASNVATPQTTPGAPTGVAASSHEDSQTTVSFSAPSNTGGSTITSYTANAYVGASLVASSSGSSSPLVISGLTNGTTYSVKVLATNGSGNGPESSSASATPSAVPGAPTGVGGTSGASQVSVSWTAPSSDGGSSITDYAVSVFAADGSSAATGVTGATTRNVGNSTTNLVFTGLTNGTAYTFKVAAINASGTGASSSASAPVTPATTPDAPTAVAASSNENTQSTVSWTAPASSGGATITDYQVSVFNSVGGSATGVTGATTRNVGSSTPHLIFTGLTNGTGYTFTVKAINTAGTGATSSASNVATPSTTPAAPSTPSASSFENTQSTVSWSAPSSGGATITDYQVHVFNSVGGSATGVTGATIRNVGSNTTNLVFTGLTNGTGYTFTVAAINASGTGSASGFSNVGTPATVPGAPTIGTATPGNGQVSVAFSAPGSNGGASITSYTVTSSPGSFSATGSGSPIVVSGLANGTAYTFTVTATNGAGTGPASSASSSVTPTGPPSAPTSPSATSHANTQSVVSWSAPSSNGGSSITDYAVSVFASDGSSAATGVTGATTRNVGGTTTNLTFTGLTNGTGYTFKIAAINSAGTGALSVATGVATPSTVPGQPTIGTATQGDTSINVVFTPPASNGGSPITVYTATCASFDGGTTRTATGTASPINVASLTLGKTYICSVTPTNFNGDGPSSGASNSLVVITVPNPPAALALTPGPSDFVVNFVPPSNNGGSAVTSYTITCTSTDGGATGSASGTSSPITVSALTDGRTYTCSGTASNVAGTSTNSAASSSNSPGDPATVMSLAAYGANVCSVHTDNTLWCWGQNTTTPAPTKLTTIARTTAADGVTTSGSKNISSASALFTASDAGQALAGSSGIGAGNTIASVTDSTHAVLSSNATSSTTSVVFTITSARTTSADGHTTNGSNAITSATGNFVSADVGRSITGTSGVASGTTIASVTNSTSATLSQNATATVTNSTFTITQAAPAWSSLGESNSTNGPSPNTCAITTSHTMYCWGASTGNAVGQMGIGSVSGATIPTLVQGGITNWKQVSMLGAANATGATCATTTDGKLWCWGSNGSGISLANGSTDASSHAVTQVGSLTTWSQVSVGISHACAVKTDGTLWCWGKDDTGQLGNGSANASTVFSPTQEALGATDWASVSAGQGYTCGVRTTGRMYCWGNNNSGQLGNGNSTEQNSPAQVLGSLTTWAQVGAGSQTSTTCAVKTDHTVWCWGANGQGQVGNGTLTAASTGPVQSGRGTSDWASVSVGYQTTCAIKTDQSQWCWGDDVKGQIGVGVQGSTTSPTQMTALSGVLAASSGNEEQCEVRTDGTLWCWGSSTAVNAATAAGAIATVTPSQVGSLTTWSTVSVAGSSFACAIKTNGTLWCWGLNTASQLGDNGTTTQTAPEQIGVATNWSKVSAGNAASCATQTDGTLWCWGSTGSGLGNNTTNATAPAKVVHATSADGTFTNGSNAVSSTTGLFTAADVGQTITASQTGIPANTTIASVTDSTHAVLSANATVSRTTAVLTIQTSGWSNPTTSADSGSPNTFCALRTGGVLWCWGSNASGILAPNTGSADASTHATPIVLPGTWTAVSVGGSSNSNFVCAISASTGALFCWGNLSGVTSGSATQLTELQVGSTPSSAYTTVSANSGNVILVRADGTAWSFGGSNGFGSLALGNTTSVTTPTQIGSATTWSFAVMGSGTRPPTMLVRSDTSAWGSGSFNYLTTLDYVHPEQVN